MGLRLEATSPCFKDNVQRFCDLRLPMGLNTSKRQIQKTQIQWFHDFLSLQHVEFYSGVLAAEVAAGTLAMH